VCAGVRAAAQIGAGPCERELDGSTPVVRHALLGGERATQGFRALGFGLLVLDVLTFESARHL
jgi:hypothetical protein